MKNIIPEIYVENCKEAIEYYKDVFGGEAKNVQLADGMEMFKGYEGKIIHAENHINQNCVIYLVDKFDDKTQANSINLVLEMDSEDEIRRLYNRLSQDGTVKFELQKTFWGAYHAIITDKFGVTWALNYSLK
ncbi:VOC family protein [Caldanaerobius polysaccharolyticus]|uniref:VOC family protein n=1 Tax=Caldanaerobius polysaccharolyticus TaxID=44256 RepID=UPI00047E9CBB|nr:VOC family protein [Caldanaerobius polysaccharolyticus]